MDINFSLPPGHYVLAVSGGVDSMALLHLLSGQAGLSFTVAHFDHGIREDSRQDRQLVQRVAKQYGWPFVYDRAELGPLASEAVAREARYQFLHRVRQITGAQAVITAHHANDRMETAILNVVRGTGRRGLSSLKSQPDIMRPLLGHSKQELKQHALDNGLVWHEDSTNKDQKYRRNYVRHQVLPRLPRDAQQQLLGHINAAEQLNDQIDQLIINQLHQQPAANQLDRAWFIQLPHSVAGEVLAGWLYYRGLEYDRPTIERLVVAAKTFSSGQKSDVNKRYIIAVNGDTLALQLRDR